ncbi:hypothetical protein VTN49DRAFT_6142 [Thermomyces lanuginosus]|uniref:uncharacterized protein n=1 Tax=Thermomyces lanuginosus TaxID=5541 RepID=UPI003741EB04
MFVARRSAAPLRRLLQQQPRRSASHSAHHHAEPVNESFGPSFYIAVSTVAVGYALYRISQSPGESFVTRLINKYWPDQKAFEERNALHTAMLEKAAVDRHLFYGAPARDYVELKDPELFNGGSPYNVPAGSRADVSAVAAYYHKRNQQIEEQRVARMKDGKVVSIYD